MRREKQPLPEKVGQAQLTLSNHAYSSKLAASSKNGETNISLTSYSLYFTATLPTLPTNIPLLGDSDTTRLHSLYSTYSVVALKHFTHEHRLLNPNHIQRFRISVRGNSRDRERAVRESTKILESKLQAVRHRHRYAIHEVEPSATEL